MDVVQKVDDPKKLDNPKKVMDLVQNFSTTCQRNRTSKGTRFSAKPTLTSLEGDGGGGVKATNSPGNLWLKRAGHGEQTTPGTI